MIGGEAMPEIEDIAGHEAVHLVFALYFGLQVKYATIIDNGNCRGCVYVDVTGIAEKAAAGDPESIAACRNIAMMKIAPSDDYPDSIDYKNSAEFLRAAFRGIYGRDIDDDDEESRAYVQKFFEDVYLLRKKLWPKIMDAKAALLEQKTIFYDGISSMTLFAEHYKMT